MDNKETGMIEGTVPAITHDFDMARWERVVKGCLKVIAVMALTIVALVGALVYSMYDYSDVVVDSMDGGNANYIGANGVINNGESGSEEAD